MSYTQQKGALLAISSGLCYGLVGYFGISFMQQGFSVSCMLFWRFFIATVCMAALVVPRLSLCLTFRKQCLWLFAYGLFFYGTSTTFYFMASKYIGTGLAMVLLFTFPACVMLINSIYYKSPIRKIYYFAFCLMMAGMYLLVDPESLTLELYGLGLGLLSALLYALYIAGSKHISIDSRLSTCMVSAGCMTCALIHATWEGSFATPTLAASWIDITAMGLVSTAVPILLLLQSMRYISSEKASMLSVLEPVFVVLFGILLLGEQISHLECIGIVIILFSSLLTLMPERKAETIE